MTCATDWDAVVIGAGPAGLTAAIYLARYRRRVLVLDGGPSRATWIPETHNAPGFPQGVAGPALLARLRTQAETFGAVIRRDTAMRVRAATDGLRVETDEGPLDARAAVLATGVVDRLPPLPGLPAAIRASVVRMCPICDAYEAICARLAVLGDGPLALREAAFLRDYTEAVDVLLLGDAAPTDGALRVELADLRLEPEGVVLVRPGEAPRRFDHLYLALGCAPQAALAVASGARQDEAGALLVDTHQMTTVDGLYAAGDVVRGLNQISVSVGEAAIAATAIHNRLRRSAA